MTNPPPALLPATTKPRRSRSNRWETALWIFGAVLILLGVGLGVGLALIVVARDNTNFDAIDVDQETWIQVFELLAPAFSTGGVISVALAIFSRVLDTNARRREMEAREAIGEAARQFARRPEQVQDALLTAGAVEAPQTAPASVPTDYSNYMRPTSDRPTPTE